MGFKHQRMLLAVCKEYDVSQIAFPLHTVIVIVISLFLEGCWISQGSFTIYGYWYIPQYWRGCLVKNQVGYLCVLNMD